MQLSLVRKKSREQVDKQRRSILESGAVRGVNNPRAQRVICLDSGNIYPYARIAARLTNGHEVGISESCVKGCEHRSMYWMFVEEWERLGRPTEHPRAHTQWRVVRLTDGKIFATAGEAGIAHGVTNASIQLACQSIHRSCAEHHWQKFDDWVAGGKRLRQHTPYDRSAGIIVDSYTGLQFASALECARNTGFSDVTIMRQAKGITKQRRFFFLQEWIERGEVPLTRKNPRAIKQVRRFDTGEVFSTISSAAVSVGGGASGLSTALKHGKPYKSVQFGYETE